MSIDQTLDGRTVTEWMTWTGRRTCVEHFGNLERVALDSEIPGAGQDEGHVDGQEKDFGFGLGSGLDLGSDLGW